MKKIFLINDHSVIKGGADAVAISQYKDFIKAGLDVELCTVVEKNSKKIKDELLAYPLQPRYLFKNLFWFNAFKRVNKSYGTDMDVVYIIHSWTKQLSPSIFYALRGKKVIIVAHDYFMACPNGGFYNYKKRTKCNLKGGGVSCLSTNCDKSSYLIKIYRWLRFWVQWLGLKICNPNIIALNEIQLNLFSQFPQVQLLKNKIDQDTYLSKKNLTQRKYLTYIGRGDPEKGVSILTNSKLITDIPIMIIGPDVGFLGSLFEKVIYKGWLNEADMNEYIDQTLIGIFPSLWNEVDPLTPWKFFSRGIPVACCGENVFGQFLLKIIPELVYSNIDELNDLLAKIKDINFYENMSLRVKRLYISEEKLRADNWSRGFDEIIA